MPATNPYIFGDRATDRQRLDTQNFLFSNYLRENLRRVIGPNVRSILDLGCAEGQLGRVMREIYPQAYLVGVDKDPEAITRAQSTADELQLRNVEYQVADIEQGLPPGPFDLIYGSFVLFDTRRPEGVLQLAYEALSPGGQLWMKDVPADMETAVNHRAYRKLAEMFLSTVDKLGAHPHIVRELPGLLAAAGFVDIREESEPYVLGGATEEGQVMLATAMGVFHNARGMMSKMHRVSESEIERLYLDVVNAALHSGKELGTEEFINIIARRPAN
ncbi:MAG TPA: methyltransferase domain-containing protein [Chloroflexia bacterium]|nr:methyltransferase domain-containing protein [Chloroflexia bacterium]